MCELEKDTFVALNEPWVGPRYSGSLVSGVRKLSNSDKKYMGTKCPVIIASSPDTQCPITECPDTETLVIYAYISGQKMCVRILKQAGY